MKPDLSKWDHPEPCGWASRDPDNPSPIIHKTYRDLKGRYTADVEIPGVGRALGHSWTSYDHAVADAGIYLREEQ